MGAHFRIMLAPAPGLAVPVIGRTAHPLSRLEGLKASYRQGRLVTIMTKRVGLDGPILKEVAMDVPAQFVALRGQTCCGAVGAVLTALEDENIDTFCRQLPGGQRSRKSSADENDSAVFQACGHDYLL